MSAEFLLLNGAKINALDIKGNTSLHLAAAHGSTGQVSVTPFFHSLIGKHCFQIEKGRKPFQYLIRTLLKFLLLNVHYNNKANLKTSTVTKRSRPLGSLCSSVCYFSL